MLHVLELTPGPEHCMFDSGVRLGFSDGRGPRNTSVERVSAAGALRTKFLKPDWSMRRVPAPGRIGDPGAPRRKLDLIMPI